MLIGLIASIAANVTLLAVVAIQRTDQRIMEAMHTATRESHDDAGEVIEALREELAEECGWNQDLRAELEMMGRQLECQRQALSKIRDAVGCALHVKR